MWGRDEQLANLVAALDGRIERTGPGPRPASAPTPAAVLAAAETTRTATVVLVGPTGIGKTALAAEARRPPGVPPRRRLVVPGHQPSHAGRRRKGAGRAARRRRRHRAEAVAHVRGWLEQTGQSWLIVVDGVVEWDDVADLMPAGGRGLVVVTTSNPSLVPPANARAVGSPPSSLPPGPPSSWPAPPAPRPPPPCGWRNAGYRRRLALAAAWVQTSGRSFDDYLRALNDPAATSNRLGRLDVSPPVTPVEAAVLCGLRAADARPGAAAILADLAAGSADAPCRWT